MGLKSQDNYRLGMKNFFLDCCSSTHTLAKDLLKSENIDNTLLELGVKKETINEIIKQQEDFFLSAKTMNAGVTRKDGVCWFAPRGNVYLTIVLFKKNLKRINNNNDALLTNFEIISTAAVTTYAYIDQFIGNLEIKWPNDILASGQKIAGIMSENLSQCIILSLSFNIDKFPLKTQNFPATSIYNEIKKFGSKVSQKYTDFRLKNVDQICCDLFADIIKNLSFVRRNSCYFENNILSIFNYNLYKKNQSLKIRYQNTHGQEETDIFKLIGLSSSGEMILGSGENTLSLASCEVIY